MGPKKEMPKKEMPGTMVYSILDRVVQFFQEETNRKRIQIHCIDPLLRHILDRMFPYIILTCILFSLILLMSLTTVSLLVFQMRQPIASIASGAIAAGAIASGAIATGSITTGSIAAGAIAAPVNTIIPGTL